LVTLSILSLVVVACGDDKKDSECKKPTTESTAAYKMSEEEKLKK